MGNLQCTEPQHHVIDQNTPDPNRSRSIDPPVKGTGNSEQDLDKHFEEVKVLGGGKTGHVVVVKPKAGGKMNFALKQIDLGRIATDQVDELKREISVLSSLNHDNLVKVHKVYESEKKISVLMDLCTGGDISARAPYTELEAAKVIYKIISAIDYMHSMGVVHRDIKIENILYKSFHPSAEPLVIEPGFSKKFLEKSEEMFEGVGTIYSMAPEVLEGSEYTKNADMWSIGVLSFILISTLKPFWNMNKNLLISQILEGKYRFNNQIWDKISPGAEKFVSALLQVDPEKRLSAKQALAHDWFKQKNYSPYRPDIKLLQKVPESIKHFRENNSLKKLALMVVSHKNNSKDIHELRRLFEHHDTDVTGIIDYDGFREVLSNFQYSEEELQKMFNGVKMGDGGVIYWNEFLAASLEAQGHIATERVTDAFNSFDTKKTGYIEADDLKNLLGEHTSTESIQEILKEVDSDGDGRISFDEFLLMFRKQQISEVREFHEETPQENKTILIETPVREKEAAQDKPAPKNEESSKGTPVPEKSTTKEEESEKEKKERFSRVMFMPSVEQARKEQPVQNVPPPSQEKNLRQIIQVPYEDDRMMM